MRCWNGLINFAENSKFRMRVVEHSRHFGSLRHRPIRKQVQGTATIWRSLLSQRNIEELITGGLLSETAQNLESDVEYCYFNDIEQQDA